LVCLFGPVEAYFVIHVRLDNLQIDKMKNTIPVAIIINAIIQGCTAMLPKYKLIPYKSAKCLPTPCGALAKTCAIGALVKIWRSHTTQYVNGMLLKLMPFMDDLLFDSF